MGFLKHFKSKARLRSQPEELVDFPRHTGPDRITGLPEKVLRNIFSQVCPSVTDHTFRVNERSLVGAGCSLCDLRDLANCSKVNHRWYSIAQTLLYHSVRIDAVHFCPHEEELAEIRRKHKVDPGQIPALRLKLFQRTVWKNANLAQQVLFLKLPYMTRETCVSDLARVVSALPKLRHVDLPDGFFNAEASTQILRDELQASCPEIRKMAYREGSEQTFEMLAQHRLWQNLQSLSLERLDVDLSVLRIVLASLPTLIEVKLRDMPRLDDMTFQSTPNLPDFPPLRKLHISNAPGLTYVGMVEYLRNPQTRAALASLGLTNTGVGIPALHLFLSYASALESFSIVSSITRGMPLEPLPPITSNSLRTLNYEVTSADAVSPPSTSYAYGHGYAANHLIRPSDSYYTYLSNSIMANALPNLRQLYVRDSTFPQMLLSPAMIHGRQQQSYGFSQMLEIYTKGDNDLDWVFTHVAPPPPPPASNNHQYTQSRDYQQQQQYQHHHSNSSLSRRPAPPTISIDAPSTHAAPPALDAPVAPYSNASTRLSYMPSPHARTGSSTALNPHTYVSPALAAPEPAPAGLGRPVSAYGASLAAAGGLAPSWGVGEARRSVVLGDGTGRFTQMAESLRDALPAPVMPAAQQDPFARPSSAGGVSFGGGSAGSGSRPGSSSGFLKGHFRASSNRASRADLWN